MRTSSFYAFVFAYLNMTSLLISVKSQAATDAPGLEYFLPTKASNYDPKVPTPEQDLGFKIGEWHIHQHELTGYLEKLDAFSDRITMRQYARSPGRHPLHVLTITSPENQARIDDIRQAHLARAHSLEGTPKEINNEPVIVWMGYSVHGNEPSGTNAAVLLAYHLAAARDEATKEMLGKTVVLLLPCLNPDGGERFAEWTNGLRGQVPSANRADFEHAEGWPSGRSNYYWFDLNRDWLPAVMPESQGRLKLYYEWEPSIVTDFHEMGNVNCTFFFQPGITKMIHPLTPPQNLERTKSLAHGQAQALDAIGSLYFTGESYDDFYPGKGSTYPDLSGSIGVLFEQASSRGFQQDTEHGRLTFPFTIRNQLTASLSTLSTAVSQRVEFLHYQRTYFQEAQEAAKASKIQAYVFDAQSDRSREDAFCKLLERHQIHYSWLAEAITANKHSFAKGSMVVPVQQPPYRLLTAMFEHRTEFTSAIFYDVSGWHIPSAYGLLSAELEATPPTAKIERMALEGSVHGNAKAYAYAFPWEPRFAPRALLRLLEAKVRCWTATKPFTNNGKTFHPGSIVVPVAEQDAQSADALHKLMQYIAKNDQFDVQALATGMNEGVPDIGSPSMKPVTNTGVLLVVGNGVTSTVAGDVWFQFDQVWKTSLAKVEAAQLTNAVLKPISTVILTGTSFSVLPNEAKAALESWVSRGGTLIAIGSSVASVAGEKWASATVSKPSADASKLSAPNTKAPPPYSEADERRAEREVKGAVVRATFDATHPLMFGYSEHQPFIEFLRVGTTSLKAASNAFLNPLTYADTPVVSGFISKENQMAMHGATPVQLREVGSGRVVFFSDNPVFRGHWLGTEKLLANAIFFSPIVKSGGGDEDRVEE